MEKYPLIIFSLLISLCYVTTSCNNENAYFRTQHGDEYVLCDSFILYFFGYSSEWNLDLPGEFMRYNKGIPHFEDKLVEDVDSFYCGENTLIVHNKRPDINTKQDRYISSWIMINRKNNDYFYFTRRFELEAKCRELNCFEFTMTPIDSIAYVLPVRQ